MHETHIPQLHLLVEVCHHLVSKCLEFGHLLPALGLVETVVGGPSIGRHLLFQAANLAAKFAYGIFGQLIILDASSVFKSSKYLPIID